MYSGLFAGVLATLALVAASPLETREPFTYPAGVKQHFYIVGNATGLAKVDGKRLGTRPLQNTYTGFSLPYGQVDTKFGYDPSSGYLYSGFNGNGQPLILGAFLQPDGTGAIKPAVKDEAGQQPIECTILDHSLLCGVMINGRNYNKNILSDYRNDSNYELSIGAVFATAVQLLVSPH